LGTFDFTEIKITIAKPELFPDRISVSNFLISLKSNSGESSTLITDLVTEFKTVFITEFPINKIHSRTHRKFSRYYI